MNNNPIYFNKFNSGRLPAINNKNKVLNNHPQIKGQGFNDLLKSKIEESKELKFSKHASTRIQSRNINLTQEHIKRINDGVKKAADKGVNDSLVIMDKIAFIVNVSNKTVITAVNEKELKDSVFTNIDGAVIV